MTVTGTETKKTKIGTIVIMRMGGGGGGGGRDEIMSQFPYENFESLGGMESQYFKNV